MRKDDILLEDIVEICENEGIYFTRYVKEIIVKLKQKEKEKRED